MQQKVERLLEEQEATQDALHEINAQLGMWQAALESHRPGKSDRLSQMFSEISEAKLKLGMFADTNNY